MEEEAQRLADEVDVYAAVEYLAGQDDLVAAVKTLNALQRKSYWEKKDIGRSLAFGRSGAQLGLMEGRRVAGSDPKRGEELLGQAKALSYNLASFAWPGWDEEEIELSTSDVAMGLDAAKLNLRLAIELKRSADPMSKAHWILGAHYLAAGNLDIARAHFEKSGTFAAEADSDSGVLLAKGYGVVTDCVESPNDEVLNSDLTNIQEKLKPLEDGEFLAEQMTTALKVFGSIGED